VKVLLLGGGGREHAIAWKLRKDDPFLELVAAPGNPGIAGVGARCVPLDPADPSAVLGLAASENPDLIVVGPEAPLAAGVSDACRSAGFRVFGPSRAAAQIESSKRFAKELMRRAGVPTASATWHTSADTALEAVRGAGAPIVIKASGLAAGKGVIVANTLDEAEHAVSAMMLQGSMGVAGAEVLVEEFMEGEELSVFAVTDGEHFVLLPAAQDHKRLLDHDAGPNTGGMGAYAPSSLATQQVLSEVSERVIAPTLRALSDEGATFSGVLYAGLMITSSGPRVVEFNCRFGDPETQVVLPVLADPLLPLLMAASEKDGLRGATAPASTSQYAVTTVVAAPGYPDSAKVGGVVTVPDDSDAMIVFQAGTRSIEGSLRASGGRVVSVTGLGGSIESAQTRSVAGAEQVGLAGGHFRRDIGWRELKRRARTS
jgi:phosphoribosylamine---glycine ligase